MPIHFEEVTGSIEAPRRADEAAESARQTPPAMDDFDARLQRALRLRLERAARLSDD